MKKRVASFWAVILVLIIVSTNLIACNKNNEDSNIKRINSVEDLAGRKVATLRGSTIIEELIKQVIPSCELVLYDTVQELLENLSSGNIDAYVAEESSNDVQNYPDLCVIASIGDSNCASIFPKTEEGQKLCLEFNEFLQKLDSEESLKKIQNIWSEKDTEKPNIDINSLTGEKGSIKLGICTDVGIPFAYIENDNYLGYEIDLAYRFCDENGYSLVVEDYDFVDLLNAVQTNKLDFGASCITITEQRSSLFTFSNATSKSSFQLVVRAEDTDITSVDYLTTDDDLAKLFAGKKIGTETGTIHSETISILLPDSNIGFYNDVDEIAVALEKGEIDAYVDDEPTARMYIEKYDGQYIVGNLEKCNYGYAFPKNNEKSSLLVSQMNEFLAELKRSGDLEKIDAIWFGNDENKKVVNYSSLTGKNGTLNFAISSKTAGVFAYEKNGEYVGYDVDIAVRFCEKYGYGINVIDTNFSAMLASVAGGRCDFAGSVITITEDRKKQMDFSDPNYYGSVVLVSRKRSDSDTPVLTESSLLDALAGYKIGYLTGSIYGQVAEEFTPKSTILAFNSVADLCIALDTGIIDGYYVDQPLGRIAKKNYPNQIIYAVVSLSNNAMIFPKGSLDSDILRSQVNQYLSEIKVNGVFNEISELWFGDNEEMKVIDYESLTGENGVLNVATSSMVGEPFAYVKDGKMVGYDLDMIYRFCKEYGYGMNVVDYDFGGMLAAVSTGKADIGAGCITITEERKEVMNFSETNYYSGGVIITKDGAIKAQNNEKSVFLSFFDGVIESFQKTFIRENRWKLFAGGIGTTIFISILSVIFGTILGFVIYLLYRKNIRIFNGPIDFTCDLLNKTPTVLILMILYYVIFGKTDMSGVWVSVICFSILFSGVVISLLKVAVKGVDKGQREAALALGYTETQAFIKVILPQSLKQFVPVYKSEIVNLIKSTAIVGYIAVQDLTKVSDIVRTRTFEPFFALIASTIIYFGISNLLIALVNRLQKRTNPQKRSQKEILKGVEVK